MTTLYDIGDEIKVCLKGKIKEFSLSEHGDCYVVELTDLKERSDRVYLDSNMLVNNSKLIKCDGDIEEAIEQLDWYFYKDDGGAADKITKDAYELLKRRVKHES